MHYFSIHSTPEKNKELYKTLCKNLHPDTPNGNLAAFIEMKKQYDSIRLLQGQSANKQPAKPNAPELKNEAEKAIEFLKKKAKIKFKKAGFPNVDNLFDILGDFIIGKK